MNGQKAAAFDNPNDMVVTMGTKTGLDCRIDGNAPYRTALFRWYVAGSGHSERFFNFTATFYEDRRGVVRYDYLSMYNDGIGGQVGVSDGTSNPPRSQSSDTSAGGLVPGKSVTFDTSS